jgi:4-hydroxy-tetrahydrodipicolinate synthase
LTSLVTPFNEDLSLDWQSFDRLVDQQVKANIQGILLFGPLGEGPSLASHERLAMIRRAKARTLPDQKVFIMSAVDDPRTSQCIEFAKLAEDAGTDCLFLTFPRAKYRASGIAKHMKLILDSVHIPVILDFDFPGIGDLPFEELIPLLDLEQVIGAFHASNTLDSFARLREVTSKNLYCGCDLGAGASLLLGGDGIISGIANVFPKEMNQVYKAFVELDFKKFINYQHALRPALLTNLEDPIASLKACLHALKQCLQHPRLPYEGLGPSKYEQVLSSLHATIKKLSEV